MKEFSFVLNLSRKNWKEFADPKHAKRLAKRKALTMFAQMKYDASRYLIGEVPCRAQLCIAEFQRKALQAHLFYLEKLCKKTELRASKRTKFAEFTGANELCNELGISKFYSKVDHDYTEADWQIGEVVHRAGTDNANADDLCKDA